MTEEEIVFQDKLQQEKDLRTKKESEQNTVSLITFCAIFVFNIAIFYFSYYFLAKRFQWSEIPFIEFVVYFLCIFSIWRKVATIKWIRRIFE